MPTTILSFDFGAEKAVSGNTTNANSTAIQIPTFKYLILPSLKDLVEKQSHP
jgi:hypothetical protein